MPLPRAGSTRRPSPNGLNGSARKVWLVYGIGPHGPIHCQAKPNQHMCHCRGRQSYTGKQIAAEVRISPATVSQILQRWGLNKLSALEPAEPVRRYERECPGELIHIDIKKLGRIGSAGHRITGRYPGRRQSPSWHRLGVCPRLH